MKAMRDMDVPRARCLPGFIDLARVDPVLRDAATQWIADFVQLYEDGPAAALSARCSPRAISLPVRSLVRVLRAGARAHLNGPPLPVDTDLVWEEGLLDVAFAFPIQSDQSQFCDQSRA